MGLALLNVIWMHPLMDGPPKLHGPRGHCPPPAPVSVALPITNHVFAQAFFTLRRGPWHFGDFRCNFQSNIGGDKKKLLGSPSKRGAPWHCAIW